MDLTKPVDEEFLDDLDGTRSPERRTSGLGVAIGCTVLLLALVGLVAVSVAFGWTMHGVLSG